MKMKRVLLSGFSLMLALLLLLGCAAASAEGAAATAFSFRNGITWASTAEEILALEGATGEDDYQVSQDGDFTAYILKDGENDVITQLAYAYLKDQLIVVAVYYESQPVELYDTKLAELTAQYGEPAETDATHANELFAAANMGSLDEGLSKISGWTLSDGTAIYLMIMYDEVYLFSFNEPLINE